MKLSRAAAALIGVFLCLPALPAEAAEPSLTLTVAQRWQIAGTAGTWTPYVVTVRNEGGRDFTGDVYMLPAESPRTGPPIAWPGYRLRLTVPHGGERSALVYVIDAPSGYVAEVRDGGRVLAQAEGATITRGGSAMGVLSDLPQAEQKITAPLRSLSRLDTSLSRFSSAQAFPTNAAFLSGLAGVVIDQFDSASLSQAQLQALHDFIGLGGTLVVAGGPSWRRTLLPLPQDLLPLRPAATASASLGPLAELAGKISDQKAQIVTGELRGTVALVADGLPLVAESVYGAGRVIELAFDPFAEPFDSQVGLAGVAWSHALSRALSTLPANVGLGRFGGAGPGTASAGGFGNPPAGPGSWAPGFANASEPLLQVLNDTPAAATPPVGLLGSLLVLYVLLAGLVNYIFLKSIGRRGLMWLTTPAIAVVFTAGAYAVGFGTRGTDFFDNEIQVQRLGPDGAVESYSFHGLFAPRKGDFMIRLPPGSLVSTVITNAGYMVGSDQALVIAGSRPEVQLSGVAVWNMKTLQTLSVTHPYSYEPKQSMVLDAHLQLINGHVKGTVTNRGSRYINDLRLVTASGAEAAIGRSLGPGQVVVVDAELLQGGVRSPIKSSSSQQLASSGSSREIVLRLAANQVLAGLQSGLALVGSVDAPGGLQIDGARPAHSGLSAVGQPVRLESADALGAFAPRPRLVSTISAEAGALVDVFDLDLPAGLRAGPQLTYTFVPAATGVRSLEVYDWDAGAWRSLGPQVPQTNRQLGVELAPGEFSRGTVRVRAVETGYNQAGLGLQDR